MKPEGSSPCSQKTATDPILSQPNPIHPIDPYLPKVHFNVISHLRLGLPSDLLPSGLQPKPFKHLSPAPCVPHVQLTSLFLSIVQ
jgi:hypothetical protein